MAQLLLVLALAYAALLFYVASRVDRQGLAGKRLRVLLYALSLSVYCSSWTFFGAVGKAVEEGWAYLPIYLGPMLLFWLGWPMLRRLAVTGSRHKVTSIADFLGNRYGKSQGLAAAVTMVAVVAALPYIALQLRAISMAWATVTQSGQDILAPVTPSWSTSLVVCVVMAWFVILFCTRIINEPDRHRGMLAAVGLEAVVKLVAFAAVALLALAYLDQLPELPAPVLPVFTHTQLDLSFVTQTLLAMSAIFCLPRQFHLLVVEGQGRRELRLARWLFPLYLFLFSLLIVPIALAGQRLFAGSTLSPDAFVLTLPMALDQPFFTALAFLGGLSAATGMIVVATLTLSIMITNELAVPLWLRSRRRASDSPVGLGSKLRYLRQLSIVVVLLLAWWLEQVLADNAKLASLGLIAFAATAQLAPAVVAGLYWQGGHRWGVLSGLTVGMGLWFYTLLLPALLGAGHPWLHEGPWGLDWLAPQGLFGSDFLDPLTHGVFWSLGINLLVFSTVSRKARFSALDLRQGVAFTLLRRRFSARAVDMEPTSLSVADLRSLMEPLLGRQRTLLLWRDFEVRSQQRLLATDRVPRFVLREAEAALASIIGAVSAHRAIELLRRARPLQIRDVATLVGGSSQQLHFNHELLHTTIETISQGISVVDRELRLVAWNRRYQNLFDLPDRLLYVGCPIERIYRFNLERGLFGIDTKDVQQELNKRLQLLRDGSAYRIERTLPTGSVIEIRGTPMAAGGFVSTYTDITEYRQMLAAVEQANEQLEARVADRTRELSEANVDLQRENHVRARLEAELNGVYASKNRFLAGASHDLLQPINAARLFVAALGQRTREYPELRTEISHLDSALITAENLITSLREIARLDSGRLTPKCEHFSAGQLLEELTREFSPLAQRRTLTLRCHSSQQWLYSDRHLLKRVLQNFLSNALRYTREGRIVLGCRRTVGHLWLEVWDSGPGIEEQDRQRIFEEFHRLDHSIEGDKGLGLGLSICQRIGTLLGHELGLDSWPGRGSVFRIRVPLGLPQAQQVPVAIPGDGSLSGMRVLCIDNESSILAGMQALLSGWGCVVTVASSLRDALQRWPVERAPDMVLADYHLDHGETGLHVLEALRYHWGALAAVVISADDSETLRQQVKEQGYQYLAKPVKPAALRGLLRAQARQRRSSAGAR